MKKFNIWLKIFIFLCFMNLIDTHTHLYLKEFSTDINKIIERAEKEGVE